MNVLCSMKLNKLNVFVRYNLCAYTMYITQLYTTFQVRMVITDFNWVSIRMHVMWCTSSGNWWLKI